MKSKLIRVHWLMATQFGIDPVLFFRAVWSIPSFLRDFFMLRARFSGVLRFRPCLHDRGEDAGTISNEYSIQDLHVAQFVFKESPRRHIDIGSRLDGFVANVASFREIEVLDVRSVQATNVNIKFRQADMTDADQLIQNIGCADSVSCLHALEHFGLGRYGDPINPDGWRLGLRSFSKLLEPGGKLYLSTPIGVERVEFNANWVFDPRSIIVAAKENDMYLQSLTLIRSGFAPEDVVITEELLETLASQEYTLGLFVFLKHH